MRSCVHAFVRSCVRLCVQGEAGLLLLGDAVRENADAATRAALLVKAQKVLAGGRDR